MINKRWFIGGFSMLAICGGAYLFNDSKGLDENFQNNPTSDIPPPDAQLLAEPNMSPSKSTQGKVPIDAQLGSLDSPPPLPEQFNANVRKWKSVSSTPSQFSELENESVDRQFIEYSESMLDGLAVGDPFIVYVPQLGISYTSKITQVEHHSNGDRTVTSRFVDDDGASYAATFTQGGGALYATIGTPKDIYFMQGGKNQGWIISGKDQDSLKTWEHTDAVIPGESEVHPPHS